MLWFNFQRVKQVLNWIIYKYITLANINHIKMQILWLAKIFWYWFQYIVWSYSSRRTSNVHSREFTFELLLEIPKFIMKAELSLYINFRDHSSTSKEKEFQRLLLIGYLMFYLDLILHSYAVTVTKWRKLLIYTCK